MFKLICVTGILLIVGIGGACGYLVWFLHSQNPMEVRPSYLFITPNCTLSCWQGIRVGNTTEPELLEFFQTDPYVTRVQKLATWLNHDENTLYVVTYDDTEISILIENGVVMMVSRIADSGFEFDLTVDDILGFLGPPSYISFSSWIDGGHSNTGLLRAQVLLLYPESGYMFGISMSPESNNTDDVQICLNDKLHIKLFQIYRFGNIQEFLGYMLFTGYEPTQITHHGLGALETWRGYQCYNHPYPST